jgi:DNA-3-methyladenine glycosylase
MNIIPRSFYLQTDVVKIARDLLGKYLVTRFNGELTSGMITETEAYEGITDKASHAYGNRLTNRTEVMFHDGGVAYVYLCYGIHSLFNIVTHSKGTPHAVLIRGILPAEGIDTMLLRVEKSKVTADLASGPGKVSKLLGIHFSASGMDICTKPDNNKEPGIWLEDRGVLIKKKKITATPRIGVDYAGKDALLQYRFVLRD